MKYRRLPRALFAIAALALAASCGEPPSDTSPECERGALGCACAIGDVCATNAHGESLRCMDAVCVPATCDPGALGCVCRAGTSCDDADSACVAGVCKAMNCRAGELHCDCLVGTCGAGLYCDASFGEGTCVDSTGFPGGPCMTNSLCHNQSRCDHATDTCIYCELGSQGCAPDRGACNAGLVYAAGRCLPPNEVPPDAPRCYTRCNNDVVTDEGALTCDAHGFLAGCMPGLECLEGSCVPVGESRRTCSDDHACPEFQACMSDGYCYANCVSNADCPSGLACHDHVCRTPCETSTASPHVCPAGTQCDSEDGRAGFCMPIAPASPEHEEASNVTAQFGVSSNSIVLGARSRSASVHISHSSVTRERFEVRKVAHRAFDGRGTRIADPRGEPGSPDFSPLSFLNVSVGGGTPTGDGIALEVPSGCGATCPALRLEVAPTLPAHWSRWEGELEVRHASMGAQMIRVSYQASIEGRWVGSMHYFSTFPDAANVANWRDGDKMDASEVRNGLIQQWVTFRRGRLNGGFNELQAILNATSIGSWTWDSVAASCPPAAACYPYDDRGIGSGVREYVSDRSETPIPTGASEYPIALSLEADPTGTSGPLGYRGAIDSAVALHYPGDPAIKMTFATRPDDPALCPSQVGGPSCLAFLSSLNVDVVVGGRSLATSAQACPSGQVLVRTPWLVPGFTSRTAGGFRDECRENGMPFASNSALNSNLGAGNPIADGNALHRRVSLLDGALIDQRHLVILFEETFATSLREDPVSAYGYMLLERTAHTVREEELATETVSTMPPEVTPARGGASCEAVTEELERMGSSLPTDPQARATLLLTGAPPSTNTISSGVHYLCVDTGLFDGGSRNHGGAGDVKVLCPPESNVRYFVLPSLTQADIAALPCQQNGTCGAQLDAWIRSTQPLTLDPAWACSGGAAYCNGDRYDLRAGKVFYRAGTSVFSPLEVEIEAAFRYKTRFQTDRGRSIGFVPVRCEGGGHLTPYCYDPAAIERIIDRVDCLLATYEGRSTPWGDARLTTLRDFLRQSLSTHDGTPGSALTGDGFERLNAELLIMLGDEAMTRALGSRFDVAATNGGSFFGSRFEPDGIDLSGIAGYEMRQLHLAVQYYERASERFFTIVAPVIFDAIDDHDVGRGSGFVVTQELVSSYLERLIGGSTKKATAWAHIAQRYQSFDRPDLARNVLRRAYMGTYLESLVLSRLMLDVAEASDATNRAQVADILEDARSRYRIAMASMREAHGRISQSGQRFGFSPDYIPFPAVDDTDTRYANAFEAVLGLARLRADTARRFEDEAITGSRSFETDTAAFEAELVQIAVQHENRLSELCGTFRGRNGRLYPAITKYASQSDRTTSMGDPCGLVGNGEIHTRIAELGTAVREVEEFARRRDHLNNRIAIEQTRVDQQCGRIFDLRNLQVGEMERRRSLQTDITRMEHGIATAQRLVGHVGQLAGLSSCSIADCFGGQVARMATYATAAALSEVVILGLQDDIVDAQSDMLSSQITEFSNQLASECRSLQIDSVPAIADIYESIRQTTHDVTQSSHKLSLQVDQLGGARLEAQRLQQQQREAEQLAIKVQSARNDPNVRVYMNTAMMNADSSFERALEHAYRATRLLEYYMSQSYDHAHELYMIRMVTRGEHTLDLYLDALEDHYEAFRGPYRARSQRAVRLSLMDDIMQIPFQDEAGRALTVRQRTEMMRGRLLDPTRLDASGRRTVEFRTSLDQFSPCTFGHQINYIETAIAGGNLGDLNANLMIWQDGTGVIHRLDQQENFHRLPPALIVATPHINRDTTFEPAIFRNFGMRERPLVNTSWRLVLEQLSPQNRDIRISEIDDIYVYIYYSDLTNPDACR